MSTSEESSSEEPSKTEKTIGLSAKSEPVEVQAALSKLAEAKPKQIMEMMAMEASSFLGNPLHNKMNEAHITQVLDVAAKHDERQYALHQESQRNEYQDTISHRRYCFAGFCIIVALTVLVLLLFKKQPDVLIPILTGLGGFVTGIAGGFGLGKSSKKE